MIPLVLASKIFSGVSFVTGMTTYGVFVVKPHWFGYYGSVYIYAKSEISTDSSISNTTANGSSFTCKFSKLSDTFPCTISVPTIDTSKKNTNIHQLKENDASVNKLEIKEAGKIFKIKISQNVKDWETKVISNDIAIVSGPTDSADTSNKVVLKPLFTLSSAKKLIGKTTYYVGQAQEDFVIDSKVKYDYEGFGWNPQTDTEIKIFNFSDNEDNPQPKTSHDKLSFKKTIPTEIKRNKHYLIQCEERDLSIWTQDAVLKYKPITGGQNKSVTFRSIKPVIYDETNEQIFTPIN